MDEFQTEDEQVKQMKQWWAQNGKSVVTLITVGLLAFGGARYWMNTKAANAEQASALFEGVVSGLETEDYATVLDKGGAVLSQYSGTAYGAMVAFAMAKAKHDQGDMASTQTYLQWVIDNGGDDAVKQLARLRLGRLLWAQEKFDEALAAISVGVPGGFAAQIEELRGDIYLAQGNADKAKQAFNLALNAPDYAGDRATLQMKLDELGSAQ